MDLKKHIIFSYFIILNGLIFCQNSAIYYLELGKMKINDFSIRDKNVRCEEAIKLFNLSISMDSNLTEAYFSRGVCYKELKKLNESLNDLNKVIYLEPDNYYAYACRAEVKFQQYNIIESIEDYSMVINKDPNHEVFLWRGKVFMANKDFNNAISDFTKVINCRSPRMMDAYFLRAQSRFEKREFALALNDLDSAIFIANQNFDLEGKANCYFLSGLIKSELLENKAAIIDFNNVINFDADNAEAFYNRGIIYLRQQEYGVAIADFTKSIEISPVKSDAYVNRGLAKQKQGEINGAIADFTLAIDLATNDVKTYYFRGLAYMGIKDFQPAIADFNYVISKNPKFEQAYESRADAFFAVRDNRSAIKDYTIVIEIDSTNKWAYFYRGYAYKKIDMLENACVDWTKAQLLGFEEAELLLKNFCR